MHPLRLLAGVAGISLLLVGCEERTASRRPLHDNVITAENSLPGDPDWRGGKPARDHALEAYADQTAAPAGEAVALRISSRSAGPVEWSLFRLGWYDGAGARKIAGGAVESAGPQAPCPPEAGTGLVRCSWTKSATVAVPADAVSGLYLVKLMNRDHEFTFVPLIVPDDRRAKLLFQASITTWQAYNDWGGTSLYVDTVHATSFGRAVKASFDRPYAQVVGRPALQDDGAGQLLRYEVHFARFLERHGYDVSYTTNVAVSEAGLSRLEEGQAFLSVGHDEYWTLAERDALRDARDRGVALLFFGANTGYWKIRLEDDAGHANPRTVVSYKGNAFADPVTGAEQTGLWRGPIARPENELVGVMYESWLHVSSQWVVSDEDHFLYRGTDLRNGDSLPGLVGYEYDRRFDNGMEPAGLQTMARSPVLDIAGVPGWSEASSYRAASGALVFSSASIEFSLGLGATEYWDPRVERMAANVIREAIGGSIPPGVGEERPSEPARRDGAFASSVSTLVKGLDSPTGVAGLPDGTVVVADARLHQILHAGRTISTVAIAGDGVASSDPAFDGVAGAQARFASPTSIVFDKDTGSLYVSDTANHSVRKIAPDAQRTVTTLSGAMGQAGRRDGPGADARFNQPMGLAMDPRTGALLVADAGNGLIRSIDPATGRTTTLAGGGSDPGDGPALHTAFALPTAVAAAPDGRIFVVDTIYGRLRMVGTDPDRLVTTLVRGSARDGDGSGEDAHLWAQGGAAWVDGAVLISEPGRGRIRKVTPGTSAASTRVETFAGSGFGDADGGGASARLGMPVELRVGKGGEVLVADPGNGSIRTMHP